MREQLKIFGLVVIGSLFGIATGFLATYNGLASFIGNPDPSSTQLLIESGLWILWVGLQGIGFVVLYTKIKQSVYAGTGIIGLFCMVLELLAFYHIWNSIEDVAFALIGIGATILYIIMVGYSLTLLRINDSLGKLTGYTFIVAGIILLVFPPAGFAILGLSNLLATAFFLTFNKTIASHETLSREPTGLALE